MNGDGSAIDVAVVGGGISGLYAAWRLSQANPSLNIRLYEQGSRIGGRLRTLGAQGAGPVELGAVGVLEKHRLVMRLCEHLGLRFTTDNRKRGGVLHLRGKSVRTKRLRRAWLRRPFPYAAPARWQRRPFASHIRELAEDILPGATTMDAGDWERARADKLFRGRPLNERLLREVLQDRLDAERLSFLEAISGADYFTRNPSGAVDALRWLVGHFTGPRKAHLLAEGYESLAKQLGSSLSRGGDRIDLHSRLVRIDVDPSDLKLKLMFDIGGTRRSVSARFVVLALPRLPIETVIAQSPSLAAYRQLRADVAAVQPWPVSTVALCYSAAWWQALGVDRLSVSDLNARQIWAYGSANTLLVASDGERSAWWRSLLPCLQSDEQGLADLDPDGSFVRETHRQISNAFGAVVPPPSPVAACFQDWGVPAFGGALHFWLPGSHPEEVQTRLSRPLAGIGLHICGEAWCLDQGWVEGALRNVEMVLQSNFGLSEPDWLTAPH